MDLKKIKLVIWDLDDTLWTGTLSEENVELKDGIIEFINNTLDMGIVHSICSKNDYQKTRKKLEEFGIWDLFVFSSIDWTPKGSRIKTIIDNMNLRSENTLFVDDNIQNLEEAKYFCGSIMTAMPWDIDSLIVRVNEEVYEKTDPERKRLSQYRILEEKITVKNNFDSNVEFLKSCDIRVEICEDCMTELERIHELLMRSNQLNYTKFRQPMDELKNLLHETDVKSGYVKVHDEFGDYGIVGFYAIRKNRAVHYLFSCRTLGMAVEQYVYMMLGCPEIQVIGEVANPLNDYYIPEWINQDTELKSAKKEQKRQFSRKVLMKGPCDMEQMFSFIRRNSQIITEFTYTNDRGVTTEGHNHTGQLLTALSCEEEKRKTITNEIEWFDENMLTTELKHHTFDVVVYSLLNDGNLGLYRRKESGEQIALCEKLYDLTDENNWDLYMTGSIFTSNIRFCRDDLERFADIYEYVPNDGTVTVQNLEQIYPKIRAEKLIILLGSEKEYPGKCTPNYVDRHLFHRKLNNMVREWSSDKKNVILLPLDKYILSQSDFADSINHLSKSTYYRLAQDLVSIINEGENELELSGKGMLLYQTIRQKMRLIIGKGLRRR